MGSFFQYLACKFKAVIAGDRLGYPFNTSVVREMALVELHLNIGFCGKEQFEKYNIMEKPNDELGFGVEE